jgi:regulator of sirC expression with transglutaminase-like and TPR domain
MRALQIAVVGIIACLLSVAFEASAAEPSKQAVIRTLREVLDIPDEQIDFATAKVMIDRIIDPSIDVQTTLAQIDAMAGHVRAMLPLIATTEQRAGALRTYLYDPGPWNRGQVFSYNFANPEGTHIPDKLLANYIRTRKGNCVSMPFLYIAIAQKLDLTVRAALAPSHVFAKLRDDKGVWHNIEATSGGYTRREILYRQDHPMTDDALANGVYMRPLSKRETIVAMAHVVAEFYSEKNNPEMLLAVSDLILERSPRDIDALLHKGYAHALMIRQRFASKYLTPRDIPMELRDEYRQLRAAADHWYDKAEALGWRMPTKEEDARYLANVKGAAAAAKR